MREQFFQNHLEAFRDVVRHRPAGSGFKFGSARTKRLEIVQMRAVPLICRRVKFEVNLVKSASQKREGLVEIRLIDRILLMLLIVRILRTINSIYRSNCASGKKASESKAESRQESRHGTIHVNLERHKISQMVAQKV